EIDQRAAAVDNTIDHCYSYDIINGRFATFRGHPGELIVATIDDAQIRCCISGAVSRWQDNRWMSGIALLGNFLSLAREFWCLLALDTNKKVGIDSPMHTSKRARAKGTVVGRVEEEKTDGLVCNLKEEGLLDGSRGSFFCLSLAYTLFG
ncbi:unnamed protein product, partial [Onchocerca flexuosa]|uniref:RNase H domain-containing protein n=1 Tax=Onchocerca flexuosa TaxID=387005 RepID=A0A183HXY0_9BILA